MFRPMRRKEKEMGELEALEIVRTGDYGILSVIQDNGYPYGVPLNYAYDDGYIYFHGAKEGNKNDSILANEKVSFTIVEDYEIIKASFDTHYRSVIIFARAKQLAGKEKIRGLRLLLEKYSPGYLKEGELYLERFKDKTSVFRLEIESITGKVGS